MELQELIARGQFVFRKAPARLRVFALVSGRLSAKEIAKKTRRSHASVLNDLRTLADVGLIELRVDKEGNPTRKERSIVYQKAPLARQIPLKYFEDSIRAARSFVKRHPVQKRLDRRARAKPLSFPGENEVLGICKQGEDEIYEFKGPGTDVRRITKEIAAFLHTRSGGMILYGVQDDGTIVGTDLRRSQLDERLQNSVRNTIKPPPNIRIRSVNVLGSDIVVVGVPPWNRKEVYFYEGRAYVRKGTNVFECTPQEVRRLHEREYIV